MRSSIPLRNRRSPLNRLSERIQDAGEGEVQGQVPHLQGMVCNPESRETGGSVACREFSGMMLRKSSQAIKQAQISQRIQNELGPRVISVDFPGWCRFLWGLKIPLSVESRGNPEILLD